MTSDDEAGSWEWRMENLRMEKIFNLENGEDGCNDH
jgi:hypothetical protein